MKRVQFIVLCIVVLLGSTVGGALGTYFFDAGVVQAAAVLDEDHEAATGNGTYTMTTSHLGYSYVLNTTTGEVKNVYVALNKHTLK